MDFINLYCAGLTNSTRNVRGTNIFELEGPKVFEIQVCESHPPPFCISEAHRTIKFKGKRPTDIWI